MSPEPNATCRLRMQSRIVKSDPQHQTHCGQTEKRSCYLKAFQLAGDTKGMQAVSNQSLTNFIGADIRAKRVQGRTGESEKVKEIGKTANCTYFQIIYIYMKTCFPLTKYLAIFLSLKFRLFSGCFIPLPVDIRWYFKEKK